MHPHPPVESWPCQGLGGEGGAPLLGDDCCNPAGGGGDGFRRPPGEGVEEGCGAGVFDWPAGNFGCIKIQVLSWTSARTIEQKTLGQNVPEDRLPTK
jgi:hypothetical protein